MKHALLLTGMLSALSGCGTKTDESACFDGDFFAQDRVLQVDITMDEADWDSLRHQTRSIPGEFAGDCRDGPLESSYTYFPAAIEIDGESASDIGIRKKGFIGSQSVDKPGFRINLDEYVEDTELFCTDNITLNNSVQDPAMIRQCLTYKFFRDAGLPAPRCNMARVSMNGDDLGIYVNVEPVKKKFLRENFSDDEGDLYEGTITDFTRAWYSTFESKTDETDETLGPIQALADDFSDSTDDLETILRRHFDYDRLLTFLAAEAWTGHWDGYGGNQNNFFVYRDPGTEKLSLIPWGTDGTMKPEQISGEEAWFPIKGYLINRILRDDEVADQFYERIGELGETAWDAEALLREVDRMNALISTEFDLTPLEEYFEGLRYFIENREASLKSFIPVTRLEDLGNPYCMVEMGTIEADFTTAWTSEEPDLGPILEAGGADIEVTWDGYDVELFEQGAYAGPAEDDFGQIILAARLDGESGDGYIIPVIYFENDELVPGAELDLDWGRGQLLYLDESTGLEPINLGEFWGGSARIDEGSPELGAEVTGSLSSGIYIWEEVGG